MIGEKGFSKLVRAACVHCHVYLVYLSPRRGYHRVLKFCILFGGNFKFSFFKLLLNLCTPTLQQKERF